MTTQTYSQDQVNTIARSYMEEIARLTEIKANKDLTILSLKQQFFDLKTQNVELIKENTELKNKLKPVEVPAGSNGAINSEEGAFI